MKWSKIQSLQSIATTVKYVLYKQKWHEIRALAHLESNEWSKHSAGGAQAKGYLKCSTGSKEESRAMRHEK
jgi:hypothetical protein